MHRWTTHHKNEGDDRKHIAPTLRQGKKIMLWGAISYGRKYPLVRIDLEGGSFNGQRYLDEIVRPHLAKHVAALRRWGQQHAKVVEDGSKIHWRKSIRAEKTKLKISNLAHPPYSPDLNPIENMWANLKKRLRRCERVPTSKLELLDAIQEEWEAIPVSTVNKLIDGMENRRRSLISSRGWSLR